MKKVIYICIWSCSIVPCIYNKQTWPFLCSKSWDLAPFQKHLPIPGVEW